MKNNYIKTAWRQLTRHKMYSAINIGGLAIGIACGLIIYKIIIYETGFDKYHKNYSNIYRLINRYNLPELGIDFEEGQAHPLGEAIRNDFLGVNAVMTYYAKKGQVTVQNEDGTPDRYQETEGLVYAEPEIFKIFDFTFLAGNPENALSNAGSIVITSSLAQKYFKLDSETVNEVLGESINIDNKTTFTVTGIIADPPENTDLPFKLIAGYADQTTSNPYFHNGTDWNEYNSATNCYLLLPNEINPTDFENQLASFFVKYNGNDSPLEQKYILQPLSDLHYGNCNNYNNRQANKNRLLLLGIIGLFIIALASINFINLSTAQASRRYKEIGVKKMIGISKHQLVFHLMGETVLISFIAAFIGVLLFRFLSMYLDDILGYRINLEIITNLNTLAFILITTFTVGILSGLYPAIIMAGMNPAESLKNIFTTKKASNSFSIRRTLVIIQFVISLVLITGTLIINKQMNYFFSKNVGFNKNAVLIATLPDVNPKKLEVLKSNLLKYPQIEKVSYNTRSPMADWRVDNPINYPGLEKDHYSGNLKTIDEDYLDLYELKLIAGNNIPERKNTGDAIINRKLAKLLGFIDPGDAIGEIFTYGINAMEFKIVGVVEDFNAQSLKEELDDVILSNLSFNVKEISVKMNTAAASLKGYNTAVDRIRNEWNKIFPDNIFNYSFLDKQIAGYYSEETKTFKLIQLFALIAIFIGSLGLYGLISFVVNQKVKEIGIRKVNGARIFEILSMLNKDLIKWILIAFLISTPIAYYTMNKWLENFAFKTNLSWWIFVLSGLLALVIALLTVSWQSWRAAKRNPVEALRYE